MTGACRWGVPRRRGRIASRQARPAATGSRVEAWRRWSSCVYRSGVSEDSSPRRDSSTGVCAAATSGVRSISATKSRRRTFKATLLSKYAAKLDGEENTVELAEALSLILDLWWPANAFLFQ